MNMHYICILNQHTSYSSNALARARERARLREHMWPLLANNHSSTRNEERSWSRGSSVNRWATAGFVIPSVYIGFPFLVLPENRPGGLSAMTSRVTEKVHPRRETPTPEVRFNRFVKAKLQ